MSRGNNNHRLFLLSGSQAVPPGRSKEFEIASPRVIEAKRLDELIKVTMSCHGQHVQFALLKEATAANLIVSQSNNLTMNLGYTKDILHLHVHFLAGCPFTQRVLTTLVQQYKGDVIITAICVPNEGSVKEKHHERIANYVRSFNAQQRSRQNRVEVPSATFPQIFYKGIPLGGSDAFFAKLSAIIKR